MEQQDLRERKIILIGHLDSIGRTEGKEGEESGLQGGLAVGLWGASFRSSFQS